MPQGKGKSQHIRLSETICKRLKATTTVVDVYDLATSNLCLRITPMSSAHQDGLKTWRFGYRHLGVPGVLTLGRYPSLSVKAARIKAGKAQLAVSEKRDPREALGLVRKPAQASAATPAIDTVKSLVWRYEKDWLSQKSDTHRINIGGIFRRHVLPAWGSRDIREITRRDLVDVHNAIKTTGSLISANRFSTTMTAWFRYLVKQGILETSPAGDLPKTAEAPRERALSMAELTLVWRAAELIGGPAGRFVQLLVLTATRRDEAAGLPRSEVDTVKQIWLLPANRNKSGRDFEIPLSTLAQDVLAACPDTGRFYFSISGARPIGGFTRIKTKLDAAIAGLQGWLQEPLEHFTLHDIRRSVRTGLSSLKVDPVISEKILNHSASKLERTYDRHAYIDEKRQALQKWAEHLSAALADSPYSTSDPVPQAAE